MIEAVNSVLSNSVLTRVSAEQQSTTRSLASNPEKTQKPAETPYVSPYISVDSNYNRAVLQIRDSDTGDVVRQFPTEGQLKAYRATQEITARLDQAVSVNIESPSDVSAAPSQTVPSATTEPVTTEV